VIKFIDMFCGIGGFRYGLERANNQEKAKSLRQKGSERLRGGQDKTEAKGYAGLGSDKTRDSEHIVGSPTRQFTCVWANDNDKYACQIYRKQFGKLVHTGSNNEGEKVAVYGDTPKTKKGNDTSSGGKHEVLCSPTRGECPELYEGDIRTVDASTIPEHNLLCAGFPCQSFSIAGKRRGFEDTRGTLFFEICRVIRAKRPSYLLLENVKGLLSHDDGDTFERIIGALDELGYDCQWQVLNSKDYGVPQNRERVFIVGHTRAKPRPKVFPIGEDPKETIGKNGVGLEFAKDISGCVNEGIGRRLRFDGSTTLLQIGLAGEKDGMGQRIYDSKGIASSLRGEGGGQGGKTGLYEVPAIRAEHHNTADVHYLPGVRRLTPLECERLQGYPDGWTEGISDSQRYKCLGNAVTVNVIEVIGRRLLRELT